MNAPIFPRLLGAHTKLDFMLPKLCSNCGSADWVALREVPLELSRHGFRLVQFPGFTMDLPFCKQCESKKGKQPVTLSGAKRRGHNG